LTVRSESCEGQAVLFVVMESARMGINITVEQVLVVIGGATAFTTFVWHAAMYVGKLTNRVEMLESRVSDHDRAISEFKGLGV
jgi:hypothetical protein